MKPIIKKALISVVWFISRLLAVLFPYRFLKRWIAFKVKCHTFWISKEFKAVGELVSIQYPINLLGGKYISLGNRVFIGKGGVLTAWDQYKEDVFYPLISIGNNTEIGEDCHITAINSISIGSNVLLGKKITITDNSHGRTDINTLNLPPIERPLYSKGPVIIEDGVWIGDKATILANVRIGKNAIVGANALVTKNVPPNCVVGGVPAKILKQIV
ncbi:MAG: putative acetyl transferase [Mucilaginibacter sp.]|nr:putative acetyl transferase [Mucilaginibacter sp.]